MNTKEKIISEVKRIEEDSMYSSKGHFYAGQCWVNVNLCIGGFAAILSAIAGASALSQFDNYNIIGGSLSIIVMALTAIITFINPSEKAIIHQKAGNQYSALRNNARIFQTIKIEKIDNEKAIDELENLNNKRNELNLESNQIPKWAFKKARKGIEDGESDYKVDKNNF